MARALSMLAIVLLLGACRGADFFAEPIPLQDGAAPVAPQKVAATTPEAGSEGGEEKGDTDETIEAPLEIAMPTPPPPQKRITYLAPNVFRPVSAGLKKTWSPHWRSEGKSSLRLGFAIIDLEGRN